MSTFAPDQAGVHRPTAFRGGDEGIYVQFLESGIGHAQIGQGYHGLADGLQVYGWLPSITLEQRVGAQRSQELPGLDRGQGGQGLGDILPQFGIDPAITTEEHRAEGGIMF